MSDDIYENKERVSLPEEDEYFECSCGWYGSDPFIMKEFGMVFYICPDCSGEVY